jgi:hypothetical protein
LIVHGFLTSFFICAGLRAEHGHAPRRGRGGVCQGQKHLAIERWPADVIEFVEGGVSDAQYKGGFGISSHISRTSNSGIEEVKVEVRIEVRALDERLNIMQMRLQSSLDAVMAKLGITVEGMANGPSRGAHSPRDDKGKDNSRRSVSPAARSMSKDHVSKVLDFGNAGEKPIVLNTKIPCGSQKASSGYEEQDQV